MTLKIEISAHPDFGPLRGQVDTAMEALGFTRLTATATHAIDPVAAQRIADAAVKQFTEQMARPDQGVATFTGDTEVQTGGTSAPQRERGKPAPGRARRTKEEIAEDEAADKADAEAAAARGSISSDPENRVGPEDEPETQEQDKADEQAEVEASRDAETPLTGEDVRSAMGLYVKKFGLPATQEDGASIFLDALGTPPKGAEGWKLSVVSEQDQPTLRKAIDAWTSAANAAERYKANG